MSSQVSPDRSSCNWKSPTELAGSAMSFAYTIEFVWSMHQSKPTVVLAPSVLLPLKTSAVTFDWTLTRMHAPSVLHAANQGGSVAGEAEQSGETGDLVDGRASCGSGVRSSARPQLANLDQRKKPSSEDSGVRPGRERQESGWGQVRPRR